MAERESELDYFFPRLKDNFPPPQKLIELQRKLYSLPIWREFSHFSDDAKAKSIRLNLSRFTEDVIPFIHYLLGDDYEFEENTFTQSGRLNPESTIVGNALHEAVSLFDLWRYGKSAESEVDSSFPTQSTEQILPFLSALQKSHMGIEEVWRNFHTDKRLVDRSKYLLSEEFGELPLCMEKKGELKIRRSEEVYNLGIQLSKNFAYNPDHDVNHFSETLEIMNFNLGQSRVQIPVRFDEIISQRIAKRRISYHIFDLKTGKQKTGWQYEFQSYLMELLGAHFAAHFFSDGKLENLNKAFCTSSINDITPRPIELSFQYGYFNKKDGDISYVPVVLDYRSSKGEMFLEWFKLYATAACVLKKYVTLYLKKGEKVDREILRFSQGELDIRKTLPRSNVIYDSRLNSRQTKTMEIYGGPFYEIGGDPVDSDKICEKCGMPMTEQYIGVGKDLGGAIRRVRVKYQCVNLNHYELDWENIDRRGIVLLEY